MKWLFLWVACAVMGACITTSVTNASANSVKIRAVQTSGASANHEVIGIQNYGEEAVNVTGWKLMYYSYSGNTSTTFLFAPQRGAEYSYLKPGGAQDFVSSSHPLAASLPNITSINGMSDSGGTVRLIDASGNIQDTVGWGTATIREGMALSAMRNTDIAVRQQDTDVNSADFALVKQASVVLMTGGIYSVVDVCTNIIDVQAEVPEGMVVEGGKCTAIDVCTNIPEVQLEPPTGMESIDGVCKAPDVCANIAGDQATLPEGYQQDGVNCTKIFVSRPLRITELLPNPDGVDTGKEYIEIHNPTDEAVDLSEYYLLVDDSKYPLPAKAISAHGYVALYATDMPFELTNATGKVVTLVGRDDVAIHKTEIYTNAPSGASWSLLSDNKWYFTQQTPGVENGGIPTVGAGNVQDDEGAAIVSICREGWYRNEETGRCRKIPEVATEKPCPEGQYRSPDTNRCRSLQFAVNSTTNSTSSRPCPEGQYRSVETNRCRKVTLTSVSLKPCQPGYTRNTVTNRCRKSDDSSTASATTPYAVKPLDQSSGVPAGWWIAGGIALAGAAYGTWEWRKELAMGYTQTMAKITGKV